MLKNKILPLLLAIGLLLSTAHAQPVVQPQTLAYQGYLTDQQNQPIQGVRNLSFKLYDQALGGNLIWSEANSVEINQGYFTVNLGLINTLPEQLESIENLYLSLQLENEEELTPRMKIGLSIKAKWAEKATRSALATHAIDVNGEHIHPNSISIGQQLVINEQGQWVGEVISGLQGPKGDKGDQGEMGYQGLQGPAGKNADPIEVEQLLVSDIIFKNDLASILANNYSNELRGPQGTQGPRGLQGLSGQDADNQLIKTNLLNDPSFVSNVSNDLVANHLSTIKGAKGDIGPQGPQGIQGIKGDKGDQGIAGPQGLQGIQGIKGDKGDQGIVGPQGLQGPQGIAGDSCTVQPLLQSNGQAVPGIMVLKCGNNAEIRLSVYQCGNGQIDQGEGCDDGNVNANDGCDYQCKIECGNGVLNGIEQCDDGNVVNTDACTNACRLASCGDGFIQAGESCDDANNVNTDSCTNACNLASCGDGFVQAGEACDDGNNVDGDACKNNCQFNYPCGANCPAIEMILIQAGSFNMGSNTSSLEQPIHNVQIRSNFYVGKTEVTVGQYRACVNAGQCTLPDTTSCNWTSSIGSKEAHPINCLDWNQARTYARWIGGDLLSEAQWEYVATAQGQAITYPWGNVAPTCQLANFNNGGYCINPPNGGTAPVCSTVGGNTAQGVCDLGGNVWEWILDEDHNSYNGAPVNELAWCSDIGVCNTNTLATRMARGGSWTTSASNLRSANRKNYSSSYRNNSVGFRVARSVN